MITLSCGREAPLMGRSLEGGYDVVVVVVVDIVMASYVTTRYCGTEAPPDYVSNSNELHVTFRSDYSISHSGFRSHVWMLTFKNSKITMVLFRMGYEAVCGGEFTSPSGVVSSPYHPQSYPRSHHSHGDNHNVQLDDYEDKCEETNILT